MASGDTLAIFGPATHQPPATNYAFFQVYNGHLDLAFTPGSPALIAIFAGVMPRNYGGGGVTVYVEWLAGATTGTGGWDVSFERMASGGHDLSSDNWATPQTITAVTVPGTVGVPQTSNVAITAGAAGTDSVAAGDGFRIRVRRLTSDTCANNLVLLNVEIKET